jgi:hypothetical protein
MKKFKCSIKIIQIIIFSGVFICCSFNVFCQDIPGWVNGKLPNEPDALYAVGMANIGPNIVMANKKADDAARVELGRILNVKVKSIFEKFTKESMDLLNQETMSSTETTSEVTKTITEATLQNVIIVERYEDEDKHVMYSLAKMKKDVVVTQFKETISQDTNKIIQEEKKPIVMKKLDEELEKWDLSQ